jgi:hypothetical protein
LWWLTGEREREREREWPNESGRECVCAGEDKKKMKEREGKLRRDVDKSRRKMSGGDVGVGGHVRWGWVSRNIFIFVLYIYIYIYIFFFFSGHYSLILDGNIISVFEEGVSIDSEKVRKKGRREKEHKLLFKIFNNQAEPSLT